MQHALQYRADANDQFQIVRHAGAVEQQRRRVVFKVDHDGAIARGFGTSRRHVHQQLTAVFCEFLQLPDGSRHAARTAAQPRVFAFKAAHEARTFRSRTVVRGRGRHHVGCGGRQRRLDRDRRRVRRCCWTQWRRRLRFAPTAHEACAIGDEGADRHRKHKKQRQTIHGIGQAEEAGARAGVLPAATIVCEGAVLRPAACSRAGRRDC